jgi:hypothetical protein
MKRACGYLGEEPQVNRQTGSGTVFKPLSDSSFDICEKVYVDPHVCFLHSVK